MSKKYSIAVIPGDGTGPEVINEGIKVLEAVAAKFDFTINFSQLPEIDDTISGRNQRA